MISLGGICVGRGWIPLHRPTIRQGVGPRCNECWLIREITGSKSTKARLSILILSKTYPLMVYLAIYLDLCRLFKLWVGFSAEKQQRVDPYFQLLAFRF
jgi:hypothetical protein